MNRWTHTWLVAAAVLAFPASSAPLTVPFDFAKAAIGVDVTLKGEPLYAILDTGVDPSVIDLARAEALGLKVDKSDAGEAAALATARAQPCFPPSSRGWRSMDSASSRLMPSRPT